MIRESAFIQRKYIKNRIRICSQNGRIYGQNSDMKELYEMLGWLTSIVKDMYKPVRI